jgi:hypothetical protein
VWCDAPPDRTLEQLPHVHFGLRESLVRDKL